MPITLQLTGHPRDLGGFTVRRVLPNAKCRAVGPFVFLDEMGPVSLGPGKAMDVRPHPHIGLSTLSWLFEGAILHRDSLGFVQPILPGAVNWMTAGRGIVHSERNSDADRDRTFRLHGTQAWLALPAGEADCEPSFDHIPAAELPIYTAEGVHAVLIAGTAHGLHSPVPVRQPTIYLDAKLSPGARWQLDEQHAERAVFVVTGEVSIDGQPVPAGDLAVLAPGPAAIAASSDAHVMLLGGAPLDGPRTLWWNFVARTNEALSDAITRWERDEFGQVPGETERIPLPEGLRPSGVK